MNTELSYTLINDNTLATYKLPVITGSMQPNVIDIRNLYQETGLFAYDPGFTSTASCSSTITYIDGE